MKLAATIITLILACAGARAQSPLTPPTAKTVGCTTAGCHAEQVNKPFLHGPTAVSACDACHDYDDPTRHTFKLKREGRQLCDFCHIDKSGTEGPVVHKPVMEGNCTGCHDPHGSNTRRMLKKSNTVELCTQCHKTVLTGAHPHEPAKQDCALCHLAHTSQHPRLLKQERRSLCLSCHADVEKTVTTASHTHKPAEGDCMQCHTPHASEHIRNLVKDPKDLCIECHESTGKTISSATHPHSATTEGKACLNCHTPHGSNHAKHLWDEPIQACLTCHKNPVEAAGGRVVPAVGELAVESYHKHGPATKGECAGCHTVHGGEFGKLLVQPYSESFYQPFSEEAYALCFKCHDRGAITDTGGTMQTGFRDGTRNLHAVHVANPTQGRSCRACHNVHASRNESMIAESISFGQWKLPLNYVKTPSGGSCAPGCHKPASYDRVTPGGSAPPGTPVPPVPPVVNPGEAK